MSTIQLATRVGRIKPSPTLAVTARAGRLGEARDRVYRAIEAIDFADGFYRRDIGWRELERIA